jgi:hypothetical protein
VKTADIYQAAFLLALGSSVEGLEVVKELDKDVCILTLQGESIKSHQESYLTSQALVDPMLYQKAINRIKDIVFKAIAHAKETSRRSGGAQ